jgi:2-hydroxychromene-2-carboxylate isomerase
MRLLAAVGPDARSVRAAMEMICAEGTDVGESAGFDKLAERLHAADPDALIAATGAKDTLRAWTDAAAARGVFGVPTLELGGELFWGLDAMPLARAVLADPGLLACGEMGRLATVDQAQRIRAPS